MRIRVLVAAALAISAVASPARADEFLLDTTIVYTPSVGGQSEPAIAFDGTNFLAVWEDHRSVTAYDVYGTRLRADGTVLDPGGIPISLAADGQYDPAVAFDGENYLVVWEDSRGTSSDIYCARVTTNGTVLDTAGIPVSTVTRHQERPRVAYCNGQYLVVWEDYRNSTIYADVRGTRVSTAGQVLDTQAIEIAMMPDKDKETPEVASDGVNWLVVWRFGGTGVHGARVNSGGGVLDSGGFVISAAVLSQASPAVTFDAANYLVAWADLRNYPPANYDIYCARVTPGATVLDTAGIAVSKAAGHQMLPAVSHGAAGSFIVWTDRRNDTTRYDIYGARVAGTGQVLDTSGIRVWQGRHTGYYPAVAAGDSFFVLWSSGNVLGARVTESGVVLDTAGIAVAVGASHQSEPAVAGLGSEYLVAWQDYRSAESEFDIYAARVSSGARVLDPTPIAVSTASGYQLSPVVAAGSGQYLVAWEDARRDKNDLYCARVAATGAALDPAGIAVSAQPGEQRHAAAEWDGSNYLVAWEDRRNGQDFDIYVARVSPAGVVLDPTGIPVAAATGDQLTPDVAFDASNWLVVWADATSGGDVHGARVTPGGQVLDTVPIVVSAAQGGQSYPSVACGGDRFLVAWMDNRSGVDRNVYGARVGTGGAVLDSAGIPVSTAEREQLYPTAAFDGSDFVVVWEDNRQSYENYDVYGARVSPDGLVGDTVVITQRQGNQRTPDIARGPDAQVLVAYSGWTEEIGGRPARTMRAWGKLYPGPGVEEAPNAEVRTTNPVPTIVRGVLLLSEAASRKPQAASLMDATGRKVIELEPGANDVSRLAPGVYFVRRLAGEHPATEKVVLQR